ncbi:hypothetical protein [Dermatophilus congolensis]|uniref:hypothetical protein n=1 Tax=Dermatophilus congolensis TaxID=1863 RepID=UPI001AAFB628|nr:hypothetical protein [Dermatophilus congolensis]MBO3141264.1 hypothetical protein [Dermatophilus congolensis]MBO3147969.1 hypothetical protein [Dermatophilus congolensis]MBO3164974.1 hypothetical protein [Dermatophilus congolensis]MBO3170512.1 hypothetical protein [Dermatophilus congolensis]MBO3180771.1 hypothetical protein [Dermatophilus congolensis]
MLIACRLFEEITCVRLFEKEQVEIARALSSPTYSQGGLMLGAAGMLLLSKLTSEDLLPEPKKELVSYLEEISQTYCSVLNGEAFVLGEQNARIAYDYASGGAGMLLATNSSFCNPLSWLPLSHTNKL